MNKEFHVLLVGLGEHDRFYQEIRVVEVPEHKLLGVSTEEVLNQVYFYGQNEIQPKHTRSVSQGDIIILPSEGILHPPSYYRVEQFGFSQELNVVDV